MASASPHARLPFRRERVLPPPFTPLKCGGLGNRTPIPYWTGEKRAFLPLDMMPRMITSGGCDGDDDVPLCPPAGCVSVRSHANYQLML